MGYVDDLIMYSRQGLEEFSKDPVQYMTYSIWEMYHDYLHAVFNYFKITEKDNSVEKIELQKKLADVFREPINETPKDFIEEIVKASKDELLDI